MKEADGDPDIIYICRMTHSLVQSKILSTISILRRSE